jgi:hypothetical protein
MCDGPRIGLSSLALPSHCQALRNVELRKEEGGDPTGANLAVGRSTAAEETAVASPYEDAEPVVVGGLRKIVVN